MRFGEVTHVDPACTCVNKEVVPCLIGLDTIDDVVVEYPCRGIERSGCGNFMDGWLSW